MNRKSFFKWVVSKWYFYALFILFGLINLKPELESIYWRDWFFLVGELLGNLLTTLLICLIPYHFYKKNFKNSK